MVPEDDFEDDPPMDWEQPQDLDVLMNETHEFRQGYQTQGANDGHEEAPQPRFPIVEDISNEDEVIQEPFPGPAGTSFGKKDTVLRSCAKASKRGNLALSVHLWTVMNGSLQSG
ncbi:hypothetical protein M422DRAFT_244178 [Sphaerobolus stellatus SS14]|nr:hypothetical protein M422DRAFT_244178 [Sphaerobolus stellatus SS14]